jgi:molybdate transport system substrate-binding protein
MGAMPDLTAQFEADTGIGAQAEFAPTVALLERLRGGATADIAILTAQGIDDLIRDRIMQPGTRTDIALSLVGIAVRSGAPTPDISTVAALKATLLAAPSLAYSKIGASGIFFAGLLERLGIAAEVNAKAIVVPSGFTAERVASGEVELAVQQISELLVVPGIEVVGPLPAEVQTVATFSAGLLIKSPRTDEASRLLRFLASSSIAPTLRAAGLEPAPQTANLGG